MKLVVEEHESRALARELGRRPVPLATSAVSLVEVLRAVRVAAPDGPAATRARGLLAGVALLTIDLELLEAAVPYTSSRVRALDAIHLASAIRARARRMLVYDARLAGAAEAAGLEVVAPPTDPRA